MNSGSWWWTGRPGVLQFMGSQRVGHDWATELNWTEVSFLQISQMSLYLGNCNSPTTETGLGGVYLIMLPYFLLSKDTSGCHYLFICVIIRLWAISTTKGWITWGQGPSVFSLIIHPVSDTWLERKKYLFCVCFLSNILPSALWWSKWEWNLKKRGDTHTHTHTRLIHFAIQQKATQHCKATIHQ